MFEAIVTFTKYFFNMHRLGTDETKVVITHCLWCNIPGSAKKRSLRGA